MKLKKLCFVPWPRNTKMGQYNTNKPYIYKAGRCVFWANIFSEINVDIGIYVNFTELYWKLTCAQWRTLWENFLKIESERKLRNSQDFQFTSPPKRNNIVQFTNKIKHINNKIRLLKEEGLIVTYLRRTVKWQIK